MSVQGLRRTGSKRARIAPQPGLCLRVGGRSDVTLPTHVADGRCSLVVQDESQQPAEGIISQTHTHSPGTHRRHYCIIYSNYSDIR